MMALTPSHQVDPSELSELKVRRLALPVLKAHPALTVDGWEFDRRSTIPRRKFDYEGVRTALLFLQRFTSQRSKFNAKSYSYALKHTAENWGDESGHSPYISNGALILAALIAGYEFRRCDYPAGINCTFNMRIEAAANRFQCHLYKR